MKTNGRFQSGMPSCRKRRWWKRSPWAGLGVFLSRPLVFLLTASVGAAIEPAATDQDQLATYRLATVPADASKELGSWIWTDKTFDRQTCRLWKDFDIPNHANVTSAQLRITADDGYQLFLDGREIGQGANWRGLTEYDVTLLLTRGHHVLAVNCFNDLYLAGLIMDLSIQLDNGKDFGYQVRWELARGAGG